jgi:hypothetical protein
MTGSYANLKLGVPTRESLSSFKSNTHEGDQVTEMRFTGCALLQEPRCILAGLNGSVEQPISILGHDEFLASSQDGMVLLGNPMWSLDSAWFRNRIVSALQEQARKFPQHKFVLLLNDFRQLKLVDDLDLCIGRYICGELATVDPWVFEKFAKPRETDIDAIYIARVEPYKRLELASKIASVAVVSRGLTDEKIAVLKKALPQAVLPNLEGGSIRELQGHEIATLLPRAHCGLILSEVEGQNRAVSEYLLSGLPVITTPCVGGRDRLLSPANSIIVEPTPEAVASAVKFIKENQFDSNEIRIQATAAIKREKQWLRYILGEVIDRAGFPSLGDRQLHIPHHCSSSSLPYSAFLQS